MDGTPFGDGYADGLYGRSNWAHPYPEGRAHEKYLAGVAIGQQDHNAGALDPAEQVSP